MVKKAVSFANIILLCLSGCASLMTSEQDLHKAQLLLQLSADRLNEKDYSKALEAAFEALKVNPDSAQAYNHLALVYMETKRFKKSEESFRKALELEPNYPEVWNNLGVLYNRLERYQEAIECFQKALTHETYLTPENAYTNMGYSYYKLNELNRAKIYHIKALDMNPNFCLAAKNLADVYVKEKNYREAKNYFEKALLHCPLYQESQYKLGLVLLKLGQKKVAKSHFEKLIERHRNGTFVERSQELLRYLR